MMSTPRLENDGRLLALHYPRRPPRRFFHFICFIFQAFMVRLFHKEPHQRHNGAIFMLVSHLSSTSGAGSSILNGSDGTLSRYTGWKKLEATPNTHECYPHHRTTRVSQVNTMKTNGLHKTQAQRARTMELRTNGREAVKLTGKPGKTLATTRDEGPIATKPTATQRLSQIPVATNAPPLESNPYIATQQMFNNLIDRREPYAPTTRSGAQQLKDVAKTDLWSAHTLRPTLPWWLVHMNSPVGETVTPVTAFLNDIQSTVLPVGRSQILLGPTAGKDKKIEEERVETVSPEEPQEPFKGACSSVQTEEHLRTYGVSRGAEPASCVSNKGDVDG